MIKIFFVLFVSLAVISSCSQNKTDVFGVWRLTIKNGVKEETPNYIIFSADSTFSLGVDSTGKEGTTPLYKGKWQITPDNEIKLIPADLSTGNPAYYTKIGDNKYKFEFYDKNGVKTKFTEAPTEWYLDKVK